MRNEAICGLVGRRLRQRRRSLDLTQRQVAEKCDLTFQQIQKYEAGQVDIPLARLVVLAKALRMPLPHILQGVEECVTANDHFVSAPVAPLAASLTA